MSFNTEIDQGEGLITPCVSSSSDKPLPSLPVAWWEPFYLRTYIVLGFALLLLPIAGAIIALWQLSESHNGIGSSVNQLLLTYLPTAVLTLIASQWRQIDHCCKITAPWARLRRSPSTASSSILLDYVSDLEVNAFFRALRLKDYTVILSISGYSLLKIATVFSTGLFTTSLVALDSKEAGLVTTTIFNSSRFNTSLSEENTDASIFYTAFGVISRNLQPDLGIEQNFLYQNFRPNTGVSGNFTATATVQAFFPELICETATILLSLPTSSADKPQPSQTIQIASPNCTTHTRVGQPTYALDCWHNDCPPQQLRGNLEPVTCTDQDGVVEERQLFTLTNLVFDNSSAINTTGPNGFVQSTAAIVCLSAYSVQSTLLTQNYTDDGSPTFVNMNKASAQSGTFNDISPASLFLAFNTSLIATGTMFGNPLDTPLELDLPDPSFKLLAAAVNGSYSDLMTAGNLQKAANSAFQQVVLQFFQKYVLDSSHNQISGTISFASTRTTVGSVSAVVISAALILASLLGGSIWQIWPRHVALDQPFSIRHITDVVRASSNFRELVNRRPAVLTPLKSYLSGALFTTKLSNGVTDRQLLIEYQHTMNRSPDRESKNDSVWWLPLTLQTWMLSVTFLLPLLIIAALEIIQHFSDTRHGIASVEGYSKASILTLTRLLPAFIMVLVATFFNSLAFNTLLLSPLRNLTKTKPIKRLAQSLLGQLLPFVLYNAVTAMDFPVLLTSSGAVIGSFLTIIVSSLLSTHAVRIGTEILLSVNDGFDFNWANSATNDSSAAIVLSLTENLNLTDPAFVYDEIALPSISISPAIPLGDLQIRIEVARAALNCTRLENNDFNSTITFEPHLLEVSVDIDATYRLPVECPFGGPGGNLSSIDFTQTFSLASGTNSSFVAKQLDLHVGPYSASSASSVGELSPDTQLDNPPGCPSLALVYGFLDGNDQSNTQISVQVCYQQIQRIPANVTYNVQVNSIGHQSQPQYLFRIETDPFLDNSTIQYATTSPSLARSAIQGTNFTSPYFPYRIQSHMEDSFSMFNQTQYASNNAQSDSPVDNFFQGVLFGKTPIPQSLLASSNEEDMQTLDEGIQAFYRRYMAQVMGANMRVQLPTTVPNSGILTPASGQLRIRQDPKTKLALQIMLGTMVVLGVASLCVTKGFRRLVSYNPCTIWGMATLVSHGIALRDLDRDSNGRDAGETGQCVRLGWWDLDTRHSRTQSSGVFVANKKGFVEQVTEDLSGNRWYGIDLVDKTQ